jgi:hypothetical protein
MSPLNDRSTDSRAPVVWHHRLDTGGVITFQIGRQGACLVAEWPSVARLTCGPDGADARLSPLPGADPGDVAKIEGAARVLVGELAGGLGIHAAAVALNDRAILLMGNSGAGKSTAAASLCRSHGALLLADDAALLQQGEGLLNVVPSETRHALTPRSADVLGLSRNHGSVPGTSVGKLLIPAPATSTRTYPVTHMVWMEFADDGDAIPRKLGGAEAAARVLGSMFRFDLPNQRARRHELDFVMRLLEQAELVVIQRPFGRPDAVQPILGVISGESHGK